MKIFRDGHITQPATNILAFRPVSSSSRACDPEKQSVVVSLLKTEKNKYCATRDNGCYAHLTLEVGDPFADYLDGRIAS